MRARKSKARQRREAARRPVPDQDYSAHVEHPRFGRSPRYTGLDVEPFGPGIHLHWNAVSGAEMRRALRRTPVAWLLDCVADLFLTKRRRIPGTAIVADPSRQNNPTVPVTHYYDVDQICRDCQRRFIFFAEEQKHWYEVLQFPLEADCVRCPDCRKQEQSLARKRRLYERLFHIKDRDWKANLTMAECALTLVEHGIFHRRQTERIRALLKAVPAAERSGKSYQDLDLRLKRLLADKNPAAAKSEPTPC